MVPRDLQEAVYASVDQRGSCVDASWAPWWRAQTAATVAVLRQTHPAHADRINAIEKRGMEFADKLEAK